MHKNAVSPMEYLPSALKYVSGYLPPEKFHEVRSSCNGRCRPHAWCCLFDTVLPDQLQLNPIGFKQRDDQRQSHPGLPAVRLRWPLTSNNRRHQTAGGGL